ncbi:MAG TPA: ATP-binding cassette domain-containing protein [Acetobacteraceae bacterium]|nr:ATP-binding cassette domain-containing protein [Acetobacteraceae bacterium]
MHDQAAEIIQGEGLSVRFGAVTALDGVDFAVRSGQVVALVGDNGAGKSTLAKLIAGAHRASAGVLRVRGRAVDLASPRDAVRLGIATIYQDLALADNLSVTENVFLGCESTWRLLGVPILRRARMRERVRALLAGLDAHIADPDAKVNALSGGQRQAVAISRALNLAAELVIMDEPTAALAVGETRKVLALVRQLRDQGKAVVLISHNIAEVFEVADRIVVLRRGRKVADTTPQATTHEDVIAWITGAHPDLRRDDPTRTAHQATPSATERRLA